MQEFIARENIKRFEAQLADCDDEEQRQAITRLIAAEQRHLSEILAGKDRPPSPRAAPLGN